MKLIQTYTFLVLIFVCAACSAPQVKNSYSSHFDLIEFLELEKTRLKDVHKVKKEVEYNGQREEKVVDDFEIIKETIVFEAADINRASLIGKYSIDSIFTSDNKLEAIKYQSKDKSLKTQYLHVYFEEEQKVRRVEAAQQVDGKVNDSKQLLIYEPKIGYSISSTQDVLLMRENSFSIKVSFF